MKASSMTRSKKSQPQTLMSINSLFSPSHYCNFAMMKHIFFLLLGGYLLIGLAACKQHSPYGDQLARIDSLADVNPDSADMLLKLTPVSSPKGRENEEVCKLLRIKTDDKLYRPVTHYRDTILQLIDYFEHNRRVLPSLLGSTGPALPYLYAGRIFADLGDAPQALDYYQRALDAIPGKEMENEECKTDNTTDRQLAKQRGLLHSFIGTLFAYQKLDDESLTSFLKAAQLSIQANDTLDIIFNYRDIAGQYKALGKVDSSLYFYQKAYAVAVQSNNVNMQNDISSQMASLYITIGNYSNARKCLEPSLHFIDSASITSIYNIASKIYLQERNVDSALICFNKLLEYGNLYGKRNAHRELSELAMKRGDIHAASKHFRNYKLLDDSIRMRDHAAIVARMHAAYNFQKHERETARLKVANAQKEKMIVISGFIISSLAGIIYVLIYRNNQNKLRNARQQQLLREIQSALENEHIAREKRSNIQEESLVVFKRTNIYKTFLLLSQTQDRNVSKIEWDDFSQEFNNYFPDFRLKLSGMFNLSTKQYRVCMLRKSGFGTTAICHLACYEKISVYSIYKRLYFQATGKKGSTADFDNLLKAL